MLRRLANRSSPPPEDDSRKRLVLRLVAAAAAAAWEGWVWGSSMKGVRGNPFPLVQGRRAAVRSYHRGAQRKRSPKAPPSPPFSPPPQRRGALRFCYSVMGKPSSPKVVTSPVLGSVCVGCCHQALKAEAPSHCYAPRVEVRCTPPSQLPPIVQGERRNTQQLQP